MGKEIIVQLASPERYYTKCYHDFMDCNLLNGEEKIIFLALKRFLDVKSEQGKVFPTIETIQDMTGWGNQKVVKYIKSLVKKGVVKKIRQGLSKPNIYILSDYSTLWTCDTVEDMAAVADNQDVKPLTPEQHIAELKRMGYTVQIKEKGLVSTEPTKVTAETSTKNYNFCQLNNTLNMAESQVEVKIALEKFPLHQIRKFFGYDAMVHDLPHLEADIAAAMEILHDTLNSNKPKIRINGEDRPSLVVTSKLMRLSKGAIIYAIQKYQEQTGRIKNPKAYMLTLLYNAPEQYTLDMTNQVQHDMYNQIDT